ncbi:MAG: zinc ribbon domain-containing protein [Treponema sp.]|jgi:putative FmdB family regulatory protein|nr:zinc ribbon domain-containing protein [Treponema sp.]
MPTYEYECKTCGHTFEVFQNMSDEPVKVCPQCGKEVRRLINGGTGIIFKGSGFYVTDKNKGSGGTSSKVKKDNKAPAAAKPAAGNPGSAAEGGKNAESKPKAEAGKT